MTKNQRAGLSIILAPMFTLLMYQERLAVVVVCVIFWIVGNVLFIGMKEVAND